MSKQMPTIAKTVMRRSKPCLASPPLWLVLVLSLMAGMCFGNRVQAQQMQTPTTPPGTMQMPGGGPSQPIPGMASPSQIQQLSLPGAHASNRNFQARRIKALNSERQKKLVSDTNKLLKLTAQLNAQVGQEQAGSFTPKQLRMLARIEKLAKSVRDKMSNPVQPSIFQSDFPFGTVPSAFP